MADVFISYARADAEIASGLATDCRKKGLSVWMDTDITVGGSFRQEISDELSAAKSVFVIWTPNSILSNWVISEAQRSLALGKYVPVRTPDLDINAIPQPFDTYHTPEIAIGESPYIQKARKVRRTHKLRSWIRKSLLMALGVGLFIGGWTAGQTAVPKPRSGTSLFVYDRLDDERLAYLSAQGSWFGPGVATKVNSVEINCWLSERNCELFEANLVTLNDQPFLQIFRSHFKITSQSTTSLAAEDDSAECIRRTLAVDRKSKSVSLIRSKVSREGMCNLVQDEALTLTLVDGLRSPLLQ
jgi:hypothetical protein